MSNILPFLPPEIWDYIYNIVYEQERRDHYNYYRTILESINTLRDCLLDTHFLYDSLSEEAIEDIYNDENHEYWPDVGCKSANLLWCIKSFRGTELDM